LQVFLLDQLSTSYRQKKSGVVLDNKSSIYQIIAEHHWKRKANLLLGKYIISADASTKRWDTFE
jgi:hypothetical protein